MTLAGDPKAALLRRAGEVFTGRFDAAPDVVAFAPGRVEILGNHTDYNGGWIISVALDLGVAAAAARPMGESGGGAGIAVYSETLDSERTLSLSDARRAGDWSDYVKGVLLELGRRGPPSGALRMALASDLPVGSGVSSSAALEVAVASAAIAATGQAPPDRLEFARLCQRAEADFVGVPCGILDQFSSIFGVAGGFLFLDCATHEHAEITCAPSCPSVLVADTGVRHELVDGRYADLRASCERAATRLGVALGRPIRFLRDVSVEELERHAEAIDPRDRARAEHVVLENERVLEGRRALESGNLTLLGELMLESHASSRDLLGNSCEELDLLVDTARDLPGVLGAKLSGGGFGGATVTLVDPTRADATRERLVETFARRFGREPRILESAPGEGGRVYSWA